MLGPKRSLACAVAFSAAALCHAAPGGGALPTEPFPGILGPPAGSYAETQVLLPATLVAGTVPLYRFSGAESWIPFDRPLYLSAFAGEERPYTLELRSANGADQATLAYTIDRRAPEPPAFTSASGDAGSLVRIGVRSNDAVFMSVDGSPFEPFSPDEARTIRSPEDSTRTVRAAAFVVDGLGNASRPSFASWRLFPDGFAPSSAPAEPPRPISISLAEDQAGLAADIVDLVGSARLTVRAPEGAVPCAAVNPIEPLGSVSSYVELSGAPGAASCVVTFPRGYDRDLLVSYGYVKDGVLFVAPQPLRFRPRFPADEGSGAPSVPVSPRVGLDASTAYVEWPANPWTIFVAVGDGDFEQYGRPLRVALGESPRILRYYALGQNGARSSVRSLELPTARPEEPPRLLGIANGGRYGPSVVATPYPGTSLRYELAEGDAEPRPIAEGSPVLGEEGLRFEGKDGEVVAYRLRLLADSPRTVGGVGPGSVERFVRFSVDRKAPPVPVVAQGLGAYSSADSLVAFREQEGTVFVSVSEDGRGPFARFEGPLSLRGSDDGRKRYVVRAYSEDEFGNRSAEMKALDILIDRSSLYADARGRPGASGSPDDPIPYLDDAMDAAMSSGKRFVYVRGTVPLRRTVVVTGKLTVRGGFDAEWNESAKEYASVVVSLDSPSSPFAFVVDQGDLGLSSLAVTMGGEGSGGLLLARSGSVSIEGSRISLSGGVEKTAVKSNSASVRIRSTTIGLAATATGRGIDVGGAGLYMDDTAISCASSIRFFEAVRISDSEAALSGLRIDASPTQAMAALTAVRSTAAVERSVVAIKGGSSSCRVFSASDARLSVSSVYIDAAWKGSVEAFSASNGSALRVAQVTALVDAPKSVFAGSSGSALEIVNSIATFSGPASVFIRSDAPLTSGSVAANCLWGFSSFVEGRTEAVSIGSLNELARPVRDNFVEEPARTFYASVKGLRRLARASSCVDGGLPASWPSPYDLFGSERAGRGSAPDIGAEEL
ncbi:MAG: hypothetical protein KKA67_13545 [Spirochaetes bacterium]|nr:hypothetical protein [Spirochaetota bacterium]MBU1079284.1 hypothetical protein [Spirochaetota bacterium]